MTPQCQGGCGKTVTEAGKWCSSCWPEPKQFQKDPTDVYPAGTWDPFDLFEKDPKPQDAVKDSHQIRLELVAAAGSLAFGPESGKEAALETISHLVTVLQHSTQPEPKKET